MESQSQNYQTDVWHSWAADNTTPFTHSARLCVGNGEEKLAIQIGAEGPFGQNSVADLKHPVLGDISVKDMTGDDCILGAEGCQAMRNIFIRVIYPFLSWCEKYKTRSFNVNIIRNALDVKYGRSRKNTILEGIERWELSGANFQNLDRILQDTIETSIMTEDAAFNSEYFTDLVAFMNGRLLMDLCNECVRLEAIRHTLIIVHETRGWIIVKDLNKLTCPRITRGAPRIHYDTSK